MDKEINRTEVKQILEKMKIITGAKSDKELCRIWGPEYSTLDNWKRAGNIPESRLISFCIKFGTDIKYLTSTNEPQNNGLMPQNLYMQLAENDMARVIEQKFRAVEVEDKIRVYNKIIRLLDETIANSEE
jgi:hypothetical protein